MLHASASQHILEGGAFNGDFDLLFKVVDNLEFSFLNYNLNISFKLYSLKHLN